MIKGSGPFIKGSVPFIQSEIPAYELLSKDRGTVDDRLESSLLKGIQTANQSLGDTYARRSARNEALCLDERMSPRECARGSRGALPPRASGRCVSDQKDRPAASS
jgi:hypothetical protein